MSKWEDSFNKNKEYNHCLCSNDNGLFVPNRQLSAIVAGLLFLFFSCFIVGYFLGKRSTIEQFTQKMNQDNFSDQIYTSVVAVNDFVDVPSVENGVVSEVAMSLDTAISVESHLNEPIALCNTHNEHDISPEKQVAHSYYYAQLIGFGTEKAAQKFTQKLAMKNVETLVKKRSSKTAKGRTIYWYQVVTPPYSDKEELSLLVNRLAKEERLSGINICSC